ncbi:hypothetical protein J3A83DRAFT_4233236, partial [Scleroderma citrinum]
MNGITAVPAGRCSAHISYVRNSNYLYRNWMRHVSRALLHGYKMATMETLKEGIHFHGPSIMCVIFPPWLHGWVLIDATLNYTAITSTDKMFTDCPSVYCQYLGINDMPCSELITCNDVSQHFNTVHGIKGMTREVEFLCRWPNCGQTIIRHNFVRHILGHERGIRHATQN